MLLNFFFKFCYAYETDCDPVDTDIYALKKLKLITDNLCFIV